MSARCYSIALAALLVAALALAGGCMHLTRVEPGVRPLEAYQGVGGPELARRFAPCWWPTAGRSPTTASAGPWPC